MSTPPNAPTTESLLAHEGWVRGIARGILFDDTQVDDVVQDAWMIARERPPRDPAALRSWLATVTKNLAKRAGRTKRRVARREEAAAQPEALPSVGELVERAEMRREVVDAVLALEEPYRQTVMLRYFEDLSAAQIAERSDTPAGTVRSRLKRGLDQLREQLDARHGGSRQAWSLALIPVAVLATGGAASAAEAVSEDTTPSSSAPAAKSGMTAASTSGGIAMLIRLVVLVAGVGVVGGALVLSLGGEPAQGLEVAALAPHATPGDAASATDEPATPANPTPLPEVPALQPPSPPGVPAPPAAPEGDHAVGGHVRDLDGRPLAGLLVELRQDQAELRTRTDIEGAYTFKLPGDGRARVWVDLVNTPGWGSPSGDRRSADRQAQPGDHDVDFSIDLRPKDAAWGRLRSRIGTNESAAMATLRSLATAQEQFRVQCVVDQDADGLGEYGWLGELAGTQACRVSKIRVNGSPFCAAILGVKDDAGRAQLSGYYFRMYLPTDRGAAVPEGMNVDPKGEARDADHQETRWICYAWPNTRGQSGNRVFMVNHAGDVYTCANNIRKYEGTGTVPAADAALQEGVRGAANLGAGIGLAAAGLKSVDGEVWVPAGN